MSATSQLAVKSASRLEVLIVQSNPADTLLTVEAFRVAGLTSGLRCVTDGEDALMYVRREGKYADVGVPDLIFLDSVTAKDVRAKSLKGNQIHTGFDAHTHRGRRGFR